MNTSNGLDENLRNSLAAKDEGDKGEISEGGRVWVFKYDGSLQCEMGRAVSLEMMRRELGNIDVYDERKKSDGLMRTQICGSPTGYANLYQIDKEDLEKAKEKGFELWEFD